ncbi:MAG: HvfC/BufC family peptide modification chaperone [Planctomycetota bacterium]|jgi:hypothetical protein
MNEFDRQLATLQFWMQSVITHPDGIRAGIDSNAAQSAITVSCDDIETIVPRSQKLDSVSRLAVYGNAYFARLVECLKGEFPALCYALGDDGFLSFAAAYIEQSPSQSYTLGELGSRFPQFLRESRPDDVESPGWPDFLIDLATVHRIYAEIFDGPGVEQSDTLSPEALDTIPVEQAENAVLVPAPCLRLVECQYPVHEYISAVKMNRQPQQPAPLPTRLVITRRDFVVRRVAVAAAEFAMLQEIIAGRSLGNAIAAGADAFSLEPTVDTDHFDVDAFSAFLQTTFRNWAVAGWFCSVRLQSAN